jgi:hypothetical protein
LKEMETVRRSVTVQPDLNDRIGQLRAMCLQNRINLDYTAALNLLAELGERWLETSTREQRETYRDVWARYMSYDEFENSVIDDWKELEEFRKWKLLKAAKK